MDLGMFDRFYPSSKTRVLVDEIRFDISRSDKNSERYVIHMHRKNIWTNKWMHYPRKKICRLATMILAHNKKRVGDQLK
jgi:hypothetical protein